MECTLCHADIPVLFSARDHLRPGDPKSRSVHWCPSCHYGGVAGVCAEEVPDFYAVKYYTHKKGPRAKPRLSVLQRILGKLAYWADNGKLLHPDELAGTGTLLDIGCGNGSNLHLFKTAGFDVVGVEPDAEAVAEASANATVHQGTAEHLPPEIAGRQFDVVLMSHVLEHCVDPIAALKNARGLQAEGGVLVVEVPNNEAGGFSMFRELWPWTDVPRHLHFFTEDSLRAALAAAGARVTAVQHVGYLRQFDPRWIGQQEDIWQQIGDRSKPKPNFAAKAWQLLFRTALASPRRKYDSMRVHAVRAEPDTRR